VIGSAAPVFLALPGENFPTISHTRFVMGSGTPLPAVRERPSRDGQEKNSNFLTNWLDALLSFFRIQWKASFGLSRAAPIGALGTTAGKDRKWRLKPSKSLEMDSEIAPSGRAGGPKSWTPLRLLGNGARTPPHSVEARQRIGAWVELTPDRAKASRTRTAAKGLAEIRLHRGGDAKIKATIDFVLRSCQLAMRLLAKNRLYLDEAGVRARICCGQFSKNSLSVRWIAAGRPRDATLVTCDGHTESEGVDAAERCSF
jgi:hypothetical protein